MFGKKVLLLSSAVSLLALAAADIRLETPGKWVDAADLIPVDPDRPYEFLCAASGGSGKLRAALHQFDRDRKRIGFHNVSADASTLTRLLRPAVKGETSVVVEDASQWDFPRKGRLLALDAAQDESDIPNRTLCFYIKSVEKTENGCRVTFDRPLRFSRPAGCRVRLHRDGGFLSCQTALPMSAPLKKRLEKADAAVPLANKLWKNTAFVKIALSTDSQQPVSVTACSLLPAEEKKAEETKKTVPSAAPAEQGMTPYGYEKVLKKTADEVVFRNHFFTSRGQRVYWSGAALRGLALPLPPSDSSNSISRPKSAVMSG